MEEQGRRPTSKLRNFLGKSESVTDQIMDLQTQVDNLVTIGQLSHLEEKVSRLDILEKQIAEMEGLLHTAVSSIQKLQQQISHLPSESSLDQINSALKDIPQNIAGQIQELAPGVVEEQAKKQLDSFDQRMEELGLRLQMQQEQLHQRLDEQPATAIPPDMDNLLSALAAIEGKISSLEAFESRLGAIEKVLPTLKKVIKAQERQISAAAGAESSQVKQDALDAVAMRQNEIELDLKQQSEQITKVLAWIRDESIRPDLDRLDTELVLIKDKFSSIEQAVVNFTREMVQTDEFEARVGLLSKEIGHLQQLFKETYSRPGVDEKLAKFEKDIDKLKSEIVWGMKQFRQRIDMLLNEIRKDLFEEEKKRFEKILHIEAEHQKQSRIASALYSEMTIIKRHFPVTFQKLGELENRKKIEGK